MSADSCWQAFVPLDDPAFEPSVNPRICPTCGQATADFVAHVGAPGYGHAGECRVGLGGCGAKLWRSGFTAPWQDYVEMDGPPELTVEDVI